MNNNVQNENEPNEIDPEPEKVHSLAESLLSLSNLRAHLMPLGEDTDAFDSLKKLERIFIKKSIKESQSKQTNTVYSGNSKRLNSEQSLISEHFW